VRKMPYLGLDVGFDGTRLRTDKRRQFLRDLFTRIDHAHAQVALQSFEARATTVISVVRAAADLKHPLSHHYAGWLRVASMTRSDLAQLDHLVALHCAQRVTGKRGVRAFRQLSRRRMHEQFGLPSFVRLWDDARRLGRGEP
jgi:hypothetical protein